MKSKAEAIAENILNIILDKVMWNGESPYSKLIECVNRQIATFTEEQLNTGDLTSWVRIKGILKHITDICHEYLSDAIIVQIEKSIENEINKSDDDSDLFDAYSCAISSLKYYAKGLLLDDIVPTVHHNECSVLNHKMSLKDENVCESNINDLFISLLLERIHCVVISNMAAYLTRIAEMIENKFVLNTERILKQHRNGCSLCASNILTMALTIGLAIPSIIFLWRGDSILVKEQVFVLSIIIVGSFCITYIVNTVVKVFFNRQVDDND